MIINQILVKRETYNVDEGIQGFSDWVTKKEDLEVFMKRVTQKANDLNAKIINICYLDDSAIIVYKEKK